MKKHKNIIGILTVGIIFYALFQGFLWIISNKLGISLHCTEIRTLIATNQDNWNQVYTSSFDQAVECRTEDCKQDHTEKVLLSLKDTDKSKFFQTSYFIRLNEDENIEKWFRSGEVKTTIPTTNGEKRVARLLKGKAGPICTQNWKVDQIHTEMTYLNDDFSEAETIIPIKDDNNEILGAIVSRFGD